MTQMNPTIEEPNLDLFLRYMESRLSVKPELQPLLEYGKTLLIENPIALRKLKLDPLL